MPAINQSDTPNIPQYADTNVVCFEQPLVQVILDQEFYCDYAYSPIKVHPKTPRISKQYDTEELSRVPHYAERLKTLGRPMKVIPVRA